MLVTFQEAAQLCGYRSRGTLYRLKSEGRLAAYLSADGLRLKLEPPGHPPLAEHLGQIIRRRTTLSSSRPAPAPAMRVGEGIPPFDVSRQRHEHYKAETARLELEATAGTLVSADEVRQEAARLGRVVRDRLLMIPDRVAPLVAACGDAREVHRLIASEIEGALMALATAA